MQELSSLISTFFAFKAIWALSILKLSSVCAAFSNALEYCEIFEILFKSVIGGNYIWLFSEIEICEEIVWKIRTVDAIM